MQGNAQKQIKNVALFAGTPPSPIPGVNGVNKYTGKQHEYFEEPTSAFVWDNAQYASNYFKAQVQGVIPGDFETERGAYIRSMDIVEQTTGSKMPNDYQTVYFQDTRIKGLYTGAKVKYGGNTWLAISPFNISDPMMQSVIRRCNAIWKHLDYYGNVKAEPFVFQDARAQSTANEYLDWSVIPNWYQKCVIQLNDDTRELLYNKRMILGSAAVEVRGVVDFITDFSGETPEATANAEPSHVLFFDVQFQQPLEIDDMERGIAGAKAFSWVIKPSFQESMTVGAEQTLSVSSLRNNEAPDVAHPVSYLFTSSQPDVLTVDDNGLVTAIGEGEATVTITLEQNPSISTEIKISVAAQSEEPMFVFTPELPAKLKQLQKYAGVVKVLQNGAETGEAVTVTAYGAANEATVTLDSASGELSIQAWHPSEQPLSLVFKAGDAVVTKQIVLEGF